LQFISYDKICEMFQVKAKEQELKHKLQPLNAILRAKDMDLPAALSREEIHQFILGLYGEHILPATLHTYTQALRDPACTIPCYVTYDIVCVTLNIQCQGPEHCPVPH
jgi:hypothetical protein